MSRRVGYIHRLASIGGPAEVRWDAPDGGYWIDPSATIHEFVTVNSGTFRKTWVGPDVWLMAHVHVGHDTIIQEGCEVAPGTIIGGEVEIGPNAKIGIGADVLPKITIGHRARIGAGAVVTHDVPPGETWVGNPARRLDASSSAQEHTTRPTPSRPATSTSPASHTPNSAPETPSPATDADELWWEWLARRDMSARRTTLPVRPPGGFIEPSAPPVAKPAHSRPSNYVGTCRTPERAQQIAESGHWPHVCDHCGYAELAGKQWDYGEWYDKGWICFTCAPNDDDGDGGW